MYTRTKTAHRLQLFSGRLSHRQRPRWRLRHVQKPPTHAPRCRLSGPPLPALRLRRHGLPIRCEELQQWPAVSMGGNRSEESGSLPGEAHVCDACEACAAEEGLHLRCDARARTGSELCGFIRGECGSNAAHTKVEGAHTSSQRLARALV